MTSRDRAPPRSAEELREYFTQFGEIESVNVKTDPNTGRSRGFAFLVFSNTEAIDKVSWWWDGALVCLD